VKNIHKSSCSLPGQVKKISENSGMWACSGDNVRFTTAICNLL
jgi:hypothetical protein